MDVFSPATRTWFEGEFDAPTEVQRRGWEAIAAGRHALLSAPTGTGKTLAAFLWAIDRAARPEPEPGDDPDCVRGRGVRVLYVSPLKALVYDIERNLRAPLAGILRSAVRLGQPVHPLRAAVRTGDTPQRERRSLVRDPAEILVTTPESLFLILGSRARETLATVATVIVDEIHAIAPTKRGVHLALSLERLGELCGRDPQRIGLSATVRPLDGVARFLGGDRTVQVVEVREPPRLELSIAVPVPDMEHVSQDDGTADADGERGIWRAIYPELLREIRAHNSTILFVNSRGLCERLAQRLNDLAGEELALAHHGSVSHAKRAEIEDRLKRGELRAIVATSSLELGIDMGAVDLVLLVESPGSVARGLQRVGRAGHAVGETSRATIYPKFRGDLLECAVVAQRMLRGDIEATLTPENALDVLAQQIVAMCVDRAWKVEDLEHLVRRAHPYRQLSHAALEAVLDMLSGRFPGGDLADLRPRIRWDRGAGELSARRGAALVTRLNAGTIPDRGHYPVHVGEGGPRIGELDEEMVFESRDGDAFLLGASTWRVEEITRDRVIVSPAPGEPGRLPFWRGDGPGRPIELGRALGELVRIAGERPDAERAAFLRRELPLDELAARNLAAYLAEQREATGELPTDRTIVVEHFRDELGDWRVCILSPFGARVHAPWAMALEEILGRRTGLELELMYTDDGIVLRFADADEPPRVGGLLDPEDVEDLVTRKLGATPLFAGLFRENAVRSLLVPRRRPEQRSPLWLQRIKTRSLLATVGHQPSFPVVLETYRQALNDVFDMDGLRELLERIRSREVRVHEVETPAASPFARSLVFAYVATYLYDGDSPSAERRAQALTLDRTLLRQLLGRAELRELIDPRALADLEAELAGLAAARRSRDADELHDLLRRLGDLSLEEARARCDADPGAWLERLERERRAVRVEIAGEPRHVAADEAGLYRDALGCAPPAGLAPSYLESVERPLERLVRRFARSHGPFHAREAAARFGLREAEVEPVLRALERDGALVLGEIRPGGTGLEWCDADVLRRLRRRSLARLRGEAAAVDGPTLARFLADWHGLAGAHAGALRLEEAIEKLEGLALPWSALAESILPRRVPGFSIDMLDAESAAGRIVWIGRAARGPGDGLVALCRRERGAELVEPALPAEPTSPLHATLLELLERRGASFLTELERQARERHPDASSRELREALWDLVWEGRVTNDTFQPLRSLARAAAPRNRRRGGDRMAGGRWSLVAGLCAREVGTTQRAVARAGMLLERYGIVSREAAQAEDLAFGPLYRVLRAMEESGRVQRGWFVEGLAGAQFGAPGAADRLRAARLPEGPREPDVTVLAAVDPAQPWGALLAWPATARESSPPPRRVAGAFVVLADGAPVLYVAAGRRRVTTFATSAARHPALVAALRVLHGLPRARGKRLLVVESIDGIPAEEAGLHAELACAGFVPDYRGFVADPRAQASRRRL